MNKLQFDALKHFPWDNEDDTIIIMALYEGYREALWADAKVVDIKACCQSYNHCRRRYLLSSRMNIDQS